MAVKPSDMVLLMHRLNAVECVVEQLHDAVESMRKVVEDEVKTVPPPPFDPSQALRDMQAKAQFFPPYGMSGSFGYQQEYDAPSGHIYIDQDSKKPATKDFLARLFHKKDDGGTQ